MKNKILLACALLLLMQPAMASAGVTLTTGDLMNYIGYGAIVLMMLLIIVAMLVTLRAFKVLSRIILKADGYTDEEIAAELKPVKKASAPKQDVWHKLLSLRPMAEEKNLVMDHRYDDIEELDNPIPAWFMYLFYATIIIGVGYMLNYHVFKTGQLQDDEYKTEVALADSAKKVFLSKAANQVDENTVKLQTDAATLASGKVIFKQSCAACHGDNGQGVVGPNLTDDFWLHGSKITDLFKTIKYGVAAKGMPTWEKQLSPKQIAEVTSYVASLRGTNPPNQKEAQGTKESGDKLASK